VLLDYFFNVRTDTFANLSARKKVLLHDIYDLPEYKSKLPPIASESKIIQIRRHQRFSVKCPAQIVFFRDEEQLEIPMVVIDVSHYGFQACTDKPLPLNVWLETTIRLGHEETSCMRAMALHGNNDGMKIFYGFSLGETDVLWQKFVSALFQSKTFGELEMCRQTAPEPLRSV
jgi:hypothetical protein